MLTAIPVTRVHTYANQDLDEMQHLVQDLKDRPKVYLAHADGMVRAFADWTMEYGGFRSVRSPDVRPNETQYRRQLRNLYARLREVAV
jgi:hypothetical protein